MKSLLKPCVLGALASCVCLSFGIAFAQAAPSWERPTTEGASPSGPPPAAVEQPQPAAAPAPAPAPAASAEESAESAEEPATVAAEEPAPAPAVSQPVEEAPAPAPEPPTVVAAPPAPAPAPPPSPRKVRESRDSNGGKTFGLRGAVGVSAFSGHKAIYTESFKGYAIQLGASASASAGLACAFDVSPLISIAAELQYSLYTAYGEFVVKTNGSDFGELNLAGVELHTVELPVLARFNFGDFALGDVDNTRLYAEAGVQFGGNMRARITANSDSKRPYLNALAVGPALGLGVNVNDVLFGVRGYFNVIEYAENSNGLPWTVQAGVTAFLF